MARVSLIIFFAFVFGGSSLVQATCRVPPQFWCDNLEISTACGVTKQCEAHKQSNAKLVEIGLYYETLCPGCRFIFSTQLTQAFLQVPSIINITIVPYGNTIIHKNSSAPGGWSYDCQHGPEECFGDFVETCAMHLYSDINVYFPFLNCLETASESLYISAEKCAKLHNLNYTEILDCANSPLGVALEHEMALKTEILWPPHAYTPWFTINGVHTEKLQDEADHDLIGLVCKTYTGSPKPKACNKPASFKRTPRN